MPILFFLLRLLHSRNLVYARSVIGIYDYLVGKHMISTYIYMCYVGSRMELELELPQ